MCLRWDSLISVYTLPVLLHPLGFNTIYMLTASTLISVAQDFHLILCPYTLLPIGYTLLDDRWTSPLRDQKQTHELPPIPPKYPPSQRTGTLLFLCLVHKPWSHSWFLSLMDWTSTPMSISCWLYLQNTSRTWPLPATSLPPSWFQLHPSPSAIHSLFGSPNEKAKVLSILFILAPPASRAVLTRNKYSINIYWMNDYFNNQVYFCAPLCFIEWLDCSCTNTSIFQLLILNMF